MVGPKQGSSRGRGAFALVLALALLSICGTASAAPPVSGEGGVSATPVTSKVEALAPGRQVFPVRGPHEYWDGMGAGRGHDGVDVGSPCGTPLVAAQAGRVRFTKYHARGGNYAVIDVKGSSLDMAYMHLREPAGVRPGQTVAAGQLIGHVGDTGNASGCHLHFEIWEGPWYGGGAPIDPMPFLVAWDRALERKAKRGARAP